MNNLIIEYTAGLIDGEGSILLERNRANEHRSPAVTVASTTVEIVDWMKENWGGSISIKPAKKESHKTGYQWHLKGNKAIEMMTILVEFLVEPTKKKRAAHIINNYKNVTMRNGRYNEERLTKKLQFEEDFFAL